jgi:hypothetical protein
MSGNVGKLPPPEPKAVEWEAFVLRRSGMPVQDIARHFNVNPKTVERWNTTVRVYFEATPGYEHSLDRLKGLVSASLDLIEEQIKGRGRHGFQAAIRVLESLGIVSREPAPDDGSDLRTKSDADLFREMLLYAEKTGDTAVFAEIRSFAVRVTGQSAERAPEAGMGIQTPIPGGAHQILDTTVTTGKRPARRIPVKVKGPVGGRRKPVRKDRNRNRKGN